MKLTNTAFGRRIIAGLTEALAHGWARQGPGGAARAGRVTTNFYMLTSVIDAANAAAAERHISMSRLMELALINYLRLPGDKT